jgi:hypothetical protein
VAHGGEVIAVYGESGVPLLAFAIMHCETIQNDTTHIVATLLSLGAAPDAIPMAFYTPYNRDLRDVCFDEITDDLEDENKQWCRAAARAKLVRTMNLTHRYHLDRASKTKRPSIRYRQVAKWRNAEALLGITYFLIGQRAAAKRFAPKAC